MTNPLTFYQIPDPKEEAKQAAETIREHHPELLEIPPKPTGWKLAFQKIMGGCNFLKNLVFANPDEFYGKNYATDELVEHSRLTARVVSIGSLLNGITNQPILFFAFKDFGNGVAIISSVILNVLIVKFTNDNGTAVAGRKYGNRAWARAGAAGMISMSILQSIAAGVGCEAMNNRPELSRLKASLLIAQQTENLENMSVTSEALESARAEYAAALREFKAMDRSAANWDTFYVRLFGAWSDRSRSWSQVSTENLSLEQRVLRLEQEAGKIKAQAKQDWQKKLAKRQELGDDVLFLQDQMPQLFTRHFDENYELRSGTETIRLAALNLNDKLMRLDIAGLGFPLFFLVLSVVTSGAACWMTLAHAEREDTAMSRDDAVGEALITYLEDLIRAAED
ncbi:MULTISPECIES: hypothetical protein [Planktothricoides]|uniref:Uncharacterized protein n=1 Tax=Planktothricoides raciborskii GIHE-MW2 TaxID=2792601 RepID=A0AAU8JIA4_9CYAN|nr:hypothetical protein [Planktothricoides sp. SR001]KOR35001.1 hypothetical protein AM228_21025 [Planktothricoides sp. SR001]